MTSSVRACRQSSGCAFSFTVRTAQGAGQGRNSYVDGIYYQWLARRQLQSTSAVLARSTSLLTTSSSTKKQTIPSRSSPSGSSSFHTTPRRRDGEYNPPKTDFGVMDMLGNTPVPSTSVHICMSDGFQLNSGAKVLDGAGVLLVGGEAFAWRPWIKRGGAGAPEMRLVNSKGQWEVSNESLGLFGLLWPRPDLLILGLGPEIRPISPELKRHISSLGMRVEVLDTRNAAAQFNLLATERGVNEVAAALIPIGWKEGVGANW